MMSFVASLVLQCLVPLLYTSTTIRCLVSIDCLFLLSLSYILVIVTALSVEPILVWLLLELVHNLRATSLPQYALPRILVWLGFSCIIQGVIYDNTLKGKGKGILPLFWGFKVAFEENICVLIRVNRLKCYEKLDNDHHS